MLFNYLSYFGIYMQIYFWQIGRVVSCVEPSVMNTGRCLFLAYLKQDFRKVGVYQNAPFFYVGTKKEFVYKINLQKY